MNIIIKNSKWQEDDKRIIFSDWFNKDTQEEVSIVDCNKMEDLAFEVGAYQSRSKARQAGRFGNIPAGYNEIWLNKKLKIYLWNPCS